MVICNFSIAWFSIFPEHHSRNPQNGTHELIISLPNFNYVVSCH